MKPWHELREFKAGLARVDSISKDLLKLVREEVEAGWFHVLVNYKPRTVKAIFGKFSDALAEVGPHMLQQFDRLLSRSAYSRRKNCFRPPLCWEGLPVWQN